MRTFATVTPRTLRPFRIQRRLPLFPHPRFGDRRWESEVVHLPNGNTIRQQTVRFKNPPFFNRRRLFTFVLYGTTVYTFLRFLVRWLDLTIEIEDDDEFEEEEMDDSQRGMGEEVSEDDLFADEDSFFIPMTWTTKLPRKFYKGSDPEWQEFIKVAKDNERKGQIVGDLIQTLLNAVKAHPQLSRQLGGGVKAGKHWLDIQWPDSPPQEHVRWGLEFADSFIAFSPQRVSDEDQQRLSKVIWPSAAFGSLWATAQSLLGINYRRAQQALGLADRDPHAPEERLKLAIEMMSKVQATREEGVSRKAQLESGGVPPRANGISGSSPGGKPAGKEETGKRGEITLPISLASLAPDSIIAKHVFHHTFHQQSRNKDMEPPKGTFVVNGLIEFRGKLGRITYEVVSYYDPKQSKYVHIFATAKNFKKWNQVPKGGN